VVSRTQGRDPSASWERPSTAAGLAAWVRGCLTLRVAVIPDDVWGKPGGAYARFATRVASTGPGSWTIRTLMPLDRRLMLRTHGRRTLFGPIGAPTVLLETTGRRSGLPRISPLLFARDGDSIVVVGSNFGQAHHPAWTGNLLADPAAVAIVRGERIPVRARLLTGADAEAAYRLMIETTSVYATYRTRTDREIRVFRLTPA
jgi:deazaflavin-dependent oxidoreductase (nitroreductase family)